MKENETSKCPSCGTPLPLDSPNAICPRCALADVQAAGKNLPAEEKLDLSDLPRSRGKAAEFGEYQPGDSIGRYKILEKIGEGGCGVVYVVEQSEPVRRRAALKVIKLGMDTKSVVARFEAERQALALMDHPNIAKVLDGGATEAGRPFFVMELVRGTRITDYCDQNNLSTDERLKLFIQVCQAIQHAHQKGIIHRDIKPSNILVTLHDGSPAPKVIDFGIAKSISNQPLTDKTVYTAFEQFIGTPAYMSPEQAALGGTDVDTRCDIYALGILLYELLTGNTPFDGADLHRFGLDRIRQIIREQEPPRPSTRLSTLTGAELSVVATRRRSAAPKLIKMIRGDLDWIVIKSLEKDRTRRYDTVTGLANDITRHLEDETVVARPPSKLYRLQKTIQKNRVVFAAAAVVFVVLILGLGGSTWLFFNERKAKQRAMAAEQKEVGLRLQALETLSFAGTLGMQNKSKGTNDLEIDGNNYSSQVGTALTMLNLARRYKDNEEIALALTISAQALCQENKYAEAEPIEREALSTFEIISINQSSNVFFTNLSLAWLSIARYGLGEILLKENKDSEAEPLLLAGGKAIEKTFEDWIRNGRPSNAYDDTTAWFSQDLGSLAQFYDKHGNTLEAIYWKNRWDQIINSLTQTNSNRQVAPALNGARFSALPDIAGWLFEDFPDTRPGATGAQNILAIMEKIEGQPIPNGILTNWGIGYISKDFTTWIYLDTNRNWLIMNPWDNRAASLALAVNQTGIYHLTGAFAREHTEVGGNGVSVAIIRNFDTTNGFFTASIPASSPVDVQNLFQTNGMVPFDLTFPLQKGETFRFVVFNGPTGTNDHLYDETALRFTVNRVGATNAPSEVFSSTNLFSKAGQHN